jgi:hypothetical protein
LPANWVGTGTQELVKYLKEQAVKGWPKTPPQWAKFVEEHYLDTVELAKEWADYIGDYSKATSEG